MHDLRFAIRSLLKSPGFALAAILTLAIAIGANTAMFSILYSVVLEPLAFHEPDRVVRVWATDIHNESVREGAAFLDFQDWKKQQTVFTSMAGTTGAMRNLTDPALETEQVSTMGISYEYFPLLGIKPLAGRAFIAADDRDGAPPVAMIGEALWQRRFGRRDIIGQRLTLDGVTYEIIGIAPESARLIRAASEVYIPLTAAVAPFGNVRGVHGVSVIARLKDNVTLEQAQAQMSVISKRLEQQYRDNKGRGAFIESAHDAMVRDARPRLLILFAAVAAVLLIACINVAGLMLARADTRVRELAIRASLGASRSRIVRQLLTESIAIAAVGGALGIVFAWLSMRTLLSLAPRIPRADAISLDVPALLFALGVTGIAAVLFGVVPALRTSSVQPALALGSTRGVMRGTRTAGRGALVIVEMALAVMLVIGAGLLLKSLANMMAVDVGIDTSDTVTFSMSLPARKYAMPDREKYPEWPAATNFFERVLAESAALPGVAQVALARNHPLDPGFTSQLSIVGKPETGGPTDEVSNRPVSPRYFETLGIALSRGRTFTADDRTTSPTVAVINESLARRYFGAENPIGQKAKLWGKERTIVGVVKGERFGGPQAPSEPAVYTPLAQLPMSDLTLIVRTRGQAEPVISAVRAMMRTIDPDVALYDVETIDTTLGRSLATPRFQAVLITSFGAIALLLAAIGLYALMAYQVQRRTNEIGIRVALGATRGEVARLILSRAFALALTGIAIGLAGALAAGRFLKAVVFEVSTQDPAIYAAVPLLLIAIALAATWLPTRRAMKLDPAAALHVD
ncbi:MAG TPA: ABC transporter permease [Thermoanaerobaculia bacterium]|nr:ABC transporter permease [Thermoanaerobaculia bacterium]